MGGEAQLLKMLEPAVRPAGSPAPAVQPRRSVDGLSFDEMLRQAESSQPIRISPHAQQTLDEMGIEMTSARMASLAEAVGRAAARGAGNALVVMDHAGMVVNVADRTLVTAVNEQRMQEQVITDIDAAVWARDAAPAAEQTRLQL
jgi:flagellar operon protein